MAGYTKDDYIEQLCADADPNDWDGDVGYDPYEDEEDYFEDEFQPTWSSE